MHNIDKYDSGNYLILDTTVENMHLLLVNIYGPNSDTPYFYSELKNKIDSYLNTQHIIIGGDFNIVMNKDLDSMNYKHLNNPKARIEVLKLMDIFNLVDIFRGKKCNFKKILIEKEKSCKTSQIRFLPYIGNSNKQSTTC